MKSYRMLIFIVVLAAIAIYVDVPNSPGLRLGSFARTFETKLGLDLVGGVQALLEADVPAGTTVTPDSMNTARTIVENRVNSLGVSETIVQLAGGDRIVVEIPGEVNPDAAISLIQQTGLLEFVDMGSSPVAVGSTVVTDYGTSTSSGTGQPTAPAATAAAGGTPGAAIGTPATTPETTATALSATPASTAGATPGATAGAAATTPGATPAATPSGTPASAQVLHTVMTGAEIDTVNVTTNSAGSYLIDFTLKPNGTKLFGAYTTANIGKYLGIVLDKKVISTPVVNDAITEGKGQISGNFTLDSANQLAVQLRYGSLPVPLKVVESNIVGPTLGQDSLRKSLLAGGIGLLLVIIFMLGYYRLPGALADLALVVYALFAYALFKLIPVTLTLPGIAGFVLSIGMAVDANILIFSRLKEELRAGKQLHQAIDLGWSRAWPSIRDSNFSTLITCAILFWFGSTFGASIVKGFSITLAIGVLVSLFTAITVTRTFLHLVLDNLKFAEHPKWFGVFGE